MRREEAVAAIMREDRAPAVFRGPDSEKGIASDLILSAWPFPDAFLWQRQVVMTRPRHSPPTPQQMPETIQIKQALEGNRLKH